MAVATANNSKPVTKSIDLRERLGARDAAALVEVILPEGPVHLTPISVQIMDDLMSERFMIALVALVPDPAERDIVKGYSISDLGIILTEAFPESLGKRSA